MSNLPLCYMHLNEFSRALEMYQKAREHCQKRDMPILVAYADYNIAYLYFLRGEYGRAIQTRRAKPPRAARRPTTLIRSRCAAWTCLKSTLMRISFLRRLNWPVKAHETLPAARLWIPEAAKALVFAAVAASRQGQAFESIKLFSTAKHLFVRQQTRGRRSLTSTKRWCCSTKDVCLKPGELARRPTSFLLPLP